MAATSVVAAVKNRYDSITAATFGGSERPPLYLGSAAQTKSDASQLRPPFVVLFDEGLAPVYDSSFGGIEGGTLRLEVYALKLDAATGVTVDSVVRAIKWGGSAPSAKAGLDWAALTLSGPNYSVSLKRTKETRSYAGFDHEGQRVHKCELVYRVVVGLNAATAPVRPS